MPNFIPTNYKQSVFLTLNFEDQIQPGTFEYAIHYLIEHKLDLSDFHEQFKNEKGGRAAYSPGVLLKIILFAYSKGITSSREIAWCCQHNIIFKALSCEQEPHFTTIADFISSQPKKIEAIFEQILLVCHEQGLLGNQLFAIDGCKMSSNASKTHSGTFKELEEKRAKIKRLIRHHINAHQSIDKKSRHAKEQSERHKQATETLNKAYEKIDCFLGPVNTNFDKIGEWKLHAPNSRR